MSFIEKSLIRNRFILSDIINGFYVCLLKEYYINKLKKES
jgi:hypothetical protein